MINLEFIESLGFMHTSTNPMPEVGMLKPAEKLSISDNFISSGIFKHKENKNLLIFFYKEDGSYKFCLAKLRADGLSNSVTLDRTCVSMCMDFYKQIIKMYVKKYI